MKNKFGQTALILVMLSAAALIFLAITFNWGRMAQTKALLSVAADQSAALLASDAASYGEAQKQTNLKDQNLLKGPSGTWLDVLLIIIAVVVAIFTFGMGAPLLTSLIAVASVAMATVSLVLQLVVIQPGITSMWNSLQKSQPTQQQFYEQAIAAALQGVVGDQVKITDYLDWNLNGSFGLDIAGQPNDSVSRFAIFYTDRLKMLNQKPIPAVEYFYTQLSELMNGETCDQNANDNSLFGTAILPACSALDCVSDPVDPACEMKIPNGFQLNDPCTGYNPSIPSTYTPYCDPCCQPLIVGGKSLRPTSCFPYTSGYTSSCFTSPNQSICNLTPTCTSNPNDPSCLPTQCLTNNPFGGGYPYLYDPSFQQYNNGISALDQLGRDQQMAPFSTTLSPELLSPPASPILEFPDGIYSFFWLMKDYSPQVDNIDPTVGLQPSQVHWCVPGGSVPAFTAPQGFSNDLTQLSLPYACTGQDCCINYLPTTLSGGVPVPSGTNFTIDSFGNLSYGQNIALNPLFGDGTSNPWIEGDNQMCMSSWPYNGSSITGSPDGTCMSNPPPTEDGLDDAVHTLDDFVKFANVFLSKDVGTLSATFSTWYDQADQWVNVSSGRLQPLAHGFSIVAPMVSNWLSQSYVNPNAWCMPTESTLLNGESSTAEDSYINSSSGPGPWGDLPHVISCLNFNATNTVNNYQACQTALTSGICPGALPAACAATTLGRSLAGNAPAYDGCAGSYEGWVKNSLTLATDEAPKFALRSQYLSDVFSKAANLETVLSQTATALEGFITGAGAKLEAAQGAQSQVAVLPNAVIYGWKDNDPVSGSGGCSAVDSLGNVNRVGCAHIVKVLAYAPGRDGNIFNGVPLPLPTDGTSSLPWIKTTTSGWIAQTRKYTLVDRDGFVYVKVTRWDEDHAVLSFPNGHTLWQSLFHNPSASGSSGTGLPGACQGVDITSIGKQIGFGLLKQTVDGLGYSMSSAPGAIPVQDQEALANAFMLNDRGDGTVDPYAGGSSSSYAQCLTQVNLILSNGISSQACAEYIASRNAAELFSGDGDYDYSLKFVDCGVLGKAPSDDLTGSSGDL